MGNSLTKYLGINSVLKNDKIFKTEFFKSRFIEKVGGLCDTLNKDLEFKGKLRSNICKFWNFWKEGNSNSAIATHMKSVGGLEELENRFRSTYITQLENCFSKDALLRLIYFNFARR